MFVMLNHPVISCRDAHYYVDKQEAKDKLTQHEIEHMLGQIKPSILGEEVLYTLTKVDTENLIIT